MQADVIAATASREAFWALPVGNRWTWRIEEHNDRRLNVPRQNPFHMVWVDDQTPCRWIDADGYQWSLMRSVPTGELVRLKGSRLPE